jgi:phage tail-like protein
VRRWLPERACLSAPVTLQGANFAYALVGLSAQRIAVRVPGRSDAPAFDLTQADANARVMPLGEVYPLSESAIEAPFANGLAQPPQYPSGDSAAEPLFALSLNNLARRGEASNFDDASAEFAGWMIDSRDTTTVWDRLYAEASIPAHTGFVVWLACSNAPRPPPRSDRTAWHVHGFGADIEALDGAMQAPQVPRAAHEHFPSELPGHPGLLDGSGMAQARDAATYGLYSVLLQNSQARVRTLSGRYLWVHVVLHGDGRVSPEIAALRAWGSRFSYVDKYLPRLYRESLFGDAATAPGAQVASLEPHFAADLDAAALPDSLRARLALEQIKPGAAAEVVVEKAASHWLLRDASQAWRLVLEDVALDGSTSERLVVYRPQATGADFTGRMLGNFAGLLTQWEDRIAAAHLRSDPAAVPPENLDWLGHWIGVAFDHALPEPRRRDWLRAAPELARWHGTRNGLRLALDVASGGLVRGGEVIVIEDFRLRRILATLLGVDMSEAHDPLLPGLVQSGNSIVGDTLVIGDQERVELMALYREEAASATEDAAAVSFYEKLAHRATVLVHREVVTQDFALLRRIVQLEAPAYVEVRICAASWPLLVGIASLVGVDTYLAAPRVPRAVQVERSVLGMGDFVLGQPVLDPRLAGQTAPVQG